MARAESQNKPTKTVFETEQDKKMAKLEDLLALGAAERRWADFSGQWSIDMRILLEECGRCWHWRRRRGQD